ncbi:fungal-specific transcription factor domain-containing protein [Crassisporium funariophilum]|nr:fungal-specific transcription factor domain-containing protein [Crassisporium funariophilum]
MTTPPGEPSPPANPSQPSVPPQPLPPTPTQPPAKPTPAPTKKPRQRKRADPLGKQGKQQKQQQGQQQQQAPASQHPTLVVQSPVPPYSSPRGPIFQPYPGTPYHIMNPSYPINGPPYPQHPQHPQHPQQHGQPINPTGPGMSGHPPQYAYPMHPNAYPHHGYPAYPQYAQPMMMYPPPRPSVAPDTPQSGPSPVMASAGTKRKRKSMPEGGRGKGADRGSDDDTAASGSDAPRQTAAQQAQAIVDLKKRTKTQRACDSCRSRKIRCDVIAESEPPVCQHCKQYGFECTFFLPITETRFKKKKLEEEAAEKEKAETSKPATTSQHEPQPKHDIGVFGPTSPAHLLHSQATINSRIYENYDLRYHHSFEVTKSGDGLIQVQKPVADDQQLVHPKQLDLHIERDVIENLLNAYFTDVAPILPIVTEAEFLATPNPPPVLIYSMCLVAAARREVPQKVFDSIRYAINSVIKAEDVLSTPSITNVQALLILCMTGDCHSQFVPNALSALWIRLGAAIRMAQDLGLHRAESVKQSIELRRRLWGACLICDRWASIAYGHPYMIDVQDCDARLPSSGDLNDLYMDELVRLSIILGRVQKTIYSPSGLTFTNDEMLYDLLADMQRWKDGLPDHLKFRGSDTPQNAGLLHLLYACVCMMFWRVFMRISYSCPAHLKFGLTVEQWSELVNMTSEAIDWLDAHERVYDVWLLVAYAATSCALVQYHTCIRRKDTEAETKLRKLRDCVRRWEGSISPDHMSARRKTAEIIALLYEATQGDQLPIEAPALNPTGGVTVKQPVLLDYKKDPTRPGGGVFVAHGKGDEFKDVPQGTIISGSSDGDGAESEGNGQEEIATGANAAPLVNITPLTPGARGGNYTNVNPAMNHAQTAPGNVQVMNVLDGAQGGSNLAEFALADNGFLEGIPGGMFDWGQWDTFFSRFSGNANAEGGGVSNMGFQQPQNQQQRMQQAAMQQNLPPRFSS